MIATRAELEAALAGARAGMARLCEAHPDHPALASARRQLDHVAAWLEGGAWPSAEQLRQLSFGVIAAREIEPLDLPLAEELHELLFALRNLPA